MLLCDCFELHRTTGLNSFQLDPLQYVSTPSYTWDSMLKMTNVKIGLIHDVNMYNMVCPYMYAHVRTSFNLFSQIETSIRGGLSVISHRRFV